MIMRELARMGHECVIVTSDSNALAQVPELKNAYETQEVDGIRIRWVRTLRYSVAKSARRILSWLHFEWRFFLMSKEDLPAPDAIIISSLSLLTILNGLLLRRRYGCRLVFEIRDIWPLTITEEGGFGKRNPFVLALGWVERLGYRHADAIVGTMPNLGEHVANVLGFKREVACIPMGIDPEALGEGLSLPNDYVKAHLPEGKFVVAHAGTIGITNALDAVLKCAERLRYRPDIHFLIVGDGDLKAGYQAEYGYLENLTFAPKVPKQMVQSVLSRCDLLYFSVHDSEVWRYGQSLNKVIDYMLSGKPVVASYTGYPSMINEAGCGTYVPAGDVAALEAEIRRYAAMPASERETMGARGRAWIIEHRSYAALANDYLKVLFPQPALPSAGKRA
jgi:glycosyltransferase involved in cell wall biosynthesis